MDTAALAKALAAGDMDAAAAIAGERWSLTAEVIHGDARGRDLGYPTANMALPADAGLAHGIYAVFFETGGVRRPAVASYGRRPTFGGGEPLLETFVFDFSGDLYGKTARVIFVAYLRPELKFDSAEALIAQMDRDSAEARRILAQG